MQPPLSYDVTCSWENDRELRDRFSHWNHPSEEYIPRNTLRLLTGPKKERTRKRKSFRRWTYDAENWRGRAKEKRLNGILLPTDEQKTSSLFLILFNFLSAMVRLYPPQLHTNFFYSFVHFNILNNSGHVCLSSEFPNALVAVCFFVGVMFI